MTIKESEDLTLEQRIKELELRTELLLNMLSDLVANLTEHAEDPSIVLGDSAMLISLVVTRSNFTDEHAIEIAQQLKDICNARGISSDSNGDNLDS